VQHPNVPGTEQDFQVDTSPPHEDGLGQPP
jgi:hypothetical protein